VQRRLEIEQFGAVTVVRLLDAELVRPDHIDALGVRLSRVADELGCRRVVLDLARLESLGSSMIGKILALCNLSPRLREVLELLRVATLLSIHPSERAAVQALEAGNPPRGPCRRPLRGNASRRGPVPSLPVCPPGLRPVDSGIMADVTQILNALSQGDPHAAGQLLPLGSETSHGG
jgi:hypothetical protein